MIAAGLGAMRLTPAAFWAMTPRELAAVLRAALGPQAAHQPFSRAEFDTLMTRFPDT